jgi:hypothetical protein
MQDSWAKSGMDQKKSALLLNHQNNSKRKIKRGDNQAYAIGIRFVYQINGTFGGNLGSVSNAGGASSCADI